jgi:cell fate regulator YaaT (PSP1 superfamily)
MPKVIGVKFRPATKTYYFDPGQHENLAMDDRIIVETSRGTEMGVVVMPIKDVDKEELKGKLLFSSS